MRAENLHDVDFLLLQSKKIEGICFYRYNLYPVIYNCYYLCGVNEEWSGYGRVFAFFL